MFAHKLHDKSVIATIAVKDLNRARSFYEDKLGLEKKEEEGDEVITYKAGHSDLLVYKSDFAGGYGATVATWPVGGDLEDIVEDLREKGVTFEHYPDMPGITLKGDIHCANDNKMKIAWFKDPDGSIIALVNA